MFHKKRNVTERTSFIVLTIMLLVLGVLTLYMCLQLLFNVQDSIDKGFILINYSNPLIKYSSIITAGFAALGMLAFPIIVKTYKLVIGFNGSKYQKAKTELALIILFSPSAIMFIINFYYSNNKIGNYPLFIVLVLMIIYFILEPIYVVITYKNNET